jgi:hypothetical protein
MHTPFITYLYCKLNLSLVNKLRFGVAIFLVSLLCTQATKVVAQGTKYPITTTTTVGIPYPTVLNEFVDGVSSKITVYLAVNDMELSSFPVKLRVVLKGLGNNVRIYSSPNFYQDPIYLSYGENYSFDAVDLENHFNVNNLIFEGYSKQQYLKNGQLPEGSYQVYVEVVDFYRPQSMISFTNPALFFIFLNGQPTLNLPIHGSKLAIYGPQNILFNWSSNHSPFAHPTFGAEYTFELWDVYPVYLDPYMVATSTQPVYSEILTQTSFLYSPSMPILLPGHLYAWRVRVSDPDGISTFTNDGYSDIFTFKYGIPCFAPTLEAKGFGEGFVKLKWEIPQAMLNYTLRYRPATGSDDTWYEEATEDLEFQIDNLKQNTRYYFEVSGYCENQESDYSNRITQKTRQNSEYECGGAPGVNAP